MREIAIHWKLLTSKKTFCGRNASDPTVWDTRKEYVTCGSCIRLMKIHGHWEAK